MTEENTTKTDDKVEETTKEKAPAEEKVEEVAEEEFVVPKQFKDLIEKIENMTVLELNELVKTIEKKFGVSAQMMAAAGPATAEAAEEKDSFTVELKSVGEQKIQVIKAVKELLGLGLKDAKDLVDGAPVVLKEDVKKEDAENMKKLVEEAGGQVELK